jgi:hypothetical protein
MLSARVPSPTTGLEVGRLHGTLEGEQALAAFDADPQCGAPAVEILVAGVEQAVFLQPPAVCRSGAGRQNGSAGGFGAVEPQLDLALEDCGHGGLFNPPAALFSTCVRPGPRIPSGHADAVGAATERW